MHPHISIIYTHIKCIVYMYNIYFAKQFCMHYVINLHNNSVKQVLLSFHFGDKWACTEISKNLPQTMFVWSQDLNLEEVLIPDPVFFTTKRSLIYFCELRTAAIYRVSLRIQCPSGEVWVASVMFRLGPESLSLSEEPLEHPEAVLEPQLKNIFWVWTEAAWPSEEKKRNSIYYND